MRNWLKSSPFWFGMAGLLVLLVGGTATWWWWDFLHSSSPGTTASTTLRNMGLLVGGGLAAVFAIWRGWVAEQQSITARRQADIANQILLNERYQRGAEMIGSPALSVRMAGIYALQRLAEESPKQHEDQIVRLLCSFVRNHTENDEEFRERFKRVSRTDKATPEDVQAALAAIRDRCQIEKIQKRPLAFRVDLGGASIVGCDLTDMDLSYAILDQARLNSCNLSGSILSDAELSQTDFSGAEISECVFARAKTWKTDFSQVWGKQPDFSDTSLMRTNFSDAKWASPIFRGAMFAGCEFKNAELTSADLSGAYFLASTNELAAQSLEFGITQSQLDEARSDPLNPPQLNGLLDANTLRPLAWNG